VREVFADTLDPEGSLVIKSNQLTTSRKELIEIQQLLISKSFVVYITTIPDSRQRFYKQEVLDKGLINIDDIYRIHLGMTTVTGEIRFYDKSGTNNFNEWELRLQPDNVAIKRIGQWADGTLYNEINVDQALESPVQFLRADFKGIAYAPRDKDPSIWVAENRVYFTHWRGKKNKTWFILEKPNNNNFKYLYFRPMRLRNSLDELF
jgi:hypothetical protein